MTANYGFPSKVAIERYSDPNDEIELNDEDFDKWRVDSDEEDLDDKSVVVDCSKR